MSKKELEKFWGRGQAYAPALHVRKWSLKEMRKGYLFYSDFNDGDADTALFGQCPEVVRIARQLYGVASHVRRLVRAMHARSLAFSEPH